MANSLSDYVCTQYARQLSDFNVAEHLVSPGQLLQIDGEQFRFDDTSAEFFNTIVREGNAMYTVQSMSIERVLPEHADLDFVPLKDQVYEAFWFIDIFRALYGDAAAKSMHLVFISRV